jgi:hypothetical protein
VFDARRCDASVFLPQAAHRKKNIEWPPTATSGRSRQKLIAPPRIAQGALLNSEFQNNL